MTIEQNCRKVESTVEAACLTAGRKREEVTVVAVTKTKPVEQVEELYRLGYRHFAENRPEGLIEKQTALPQEDIYWHYIGTLQTRKVKQVINRIAYFHALDRMSLAKEINERAEKPVFLLRAGQCYRRKLETWAFRIRGNTFHQESGGLPKYHCCRLDDDGTH